MPAKTGERGMVLANERQLNQARRVVEALPHARQSFTATAPSGESIPLPPELSAIMSRILRAMAEGGTITVSAMPEELTTTMAAKQLGVSRPTLMKMIREREIKARKVGTHTRLRTADVLKFRRQRRERRRRAFAELRALEEEGWASGSNGLSSAPPSSGPCPCRSLGCSSTRTFSTRKPCWSGWRFSICARKTKFTASTGPRTSLPRPSIG